MSAKQSLFYTTNHTRCIIIVYSLGLPQTQCRCEIPDIYKKVSKEVCEADATAVELGRMNKYFYDYGRYVTRFDRVGYIGPMLVDVSVDHGGAKRERESEPELKYLSIISAHRHADSVHVC